MVLSGVAKFFLKDDGKLFRDFVVVFTSQGCRSHRSIIPHLMHRDVFSVASVGNRQCCWHSLDYHQGQFSALMAGSLSDVIR